MSVDRVVGSSNGSPVGGVVGDPPVVINLSVQMSEGGIDSFAASGREDVVLALVEKWHTRVDFVRKVAVEDEARLTQGRGPLGPPPAGTPTSKVSPFKPRPA